VWVNLIYSKLFFLKNFTVHVNINSASELNSLQWFFEKKKKYYSLMNNTEKEKQPRAALNLTAF